jgi:hypothetical protein
MGPELGNEPGVKPKLHHWLMTRLLEVLPWSAAPLRRDQADDPVVDRRSPHAPAWFTPVGRPAKHGRRGLLLVHRR